MPATPAPASDPTASLLTALQQLSSLAPMASDEDPGVRQPELNRGLSTPDIPASTRALAQLVAAQPNGRLY